MISPRWERMEAKGNLTFYLIILKIYKDDRYLLLKQSNLLPIYVSSNELCEVYCELVQS